MLGVPLALVLALFAGMGVLAGALGVIVAVNITLLTAIFFYARSKVG